MPEFFLFFTYAAMYMLIHLFDILIVAKLFSVFFEDLPRSGLPTVLSYALYYFASGAAHVFFKTELPALCVSIPALFIITLNYKSTFGKKVLCVAFSFIIMFAADIFISVIMGYYNENILIRGSYGSIYGQALIRIFTYVIAVTASYLKNIKKDIPVGKLSWLVTICVPVSTMYLEYNIIMSENISRVHVCISIITVLLLNFICLYMYNSLSSLYQAKMNEALLKQEKSYYLNQCELMKESTDQLKAFRHDMKNQFFMFKEMCDKKMYDELSAGLGKYAEDIETHKCYSQSENMIIDSIVNFKLKNADIDNISVETEISVPSKINMDISDLVTILGNLLDNSLTALSSVKENKKLYLKIAYNRRRIILSVKNTYSTPVKYSDGEIITSKADADNHGYGLSGIKKAVEKYDGYLEIDHDGGVFSVDIIMFTN